MKKYYVNFGLLILIIAASNLQAAQIFFDRQTTVRTSDGVQLSNTGDYLAAYGWFVGGFTPTLANYSTWMGNFKGTAGYHVRQGSLNQISAGPVLNFDTGPLHDGEEVLDYLPKLGSASVNSLLGTAQAGDLLPENQAFVLILWNASNISSATEAAIVTNTTNPANSLLSWKVTTQFDVPNPDLVDVNGTLTGMTAVYGSATGGTGGFIQMALVPEPSTGALMMIGAAGLVALRRLRKV